MGRGWVESELSYAEATAAVRRHISASTCGALHGSGPANLNGEPHIFHCSAPE